MTAPAPWRCPDCLAWLAPHVTEHRCDPPEGVIKVTSIDPSGPLPLTFTGSGVNTTTLPGTITVNVQGSVTSENELADIIQRKLLQRAQANWSGPRRTA